MAKRRVGSQTVNLIPGHKNSGITLIYFCVGGVPHIVGKLSMRVIIWFIPHLNRRFAQKLWGSKVVGEPISKILGLPTWESQDKITFGCSPCGFKKNTIRGKVVASPKFKPWWVLWVHVCPWFVSAPKCSNYALTNVLFTLCKFVWIINSLVICPSPHCKAPARPSTPKVLRTKKRALSLTSFVIFTFGFAFESIKEFGGAPTVHTILYNTLPPKW